MASEPLARIRCDPTTLAGIVEAAALRSGVADAHDVMFSRIYPDRIDSPAAAPDADQVSYSTGRASMFESLEVLVEPPVDVLFDIDRSLDVLYWLGDGEGPATVTFEGDPESRVVESLVHETPEATASYPADTDWSHEELYLGLPDRFEDGRFLGADGEPVPTVAALETADLERLVRGSDLTGESGYTIDVGEGGVGVEAASDDGVAVEARAEASVRGPAVTRRVAPGFARVAHSMEGGIELQTGPGEPLAVVKDREHFTLRFVVYPPSG